jgi:hypothetical protein
VAGSAVWLAALALCPPNTHPRPATNEPAARQLTNQDGRVDGQTTVFTKNMGSMDVLPFLGKHLNVYLPLLLVVHCALIYFNLWDRLVESCVGAKYAFEE